MKNILGLLKIKIIKWFIVPVLLFSIWLIFAVAVNPYSSFTILEYQHSYKELKKIKIGKLLKNEKILGEFIAKENNLGIIAIRIKKEIVPHGFEEDELLFRIREKGKKEWYYEEIYTTGPLGEKQLFPFGFLPISDSVKKTYEFELLSINGSTFNAHEIPAEDIMYVSKYKFNKQDIFSTNTSLKEFLQKKMKIFFTNEDHLLASSLYFLPFAFYISFITLIKVMFTKKPFALFVLLVIFFDIVLLPSLFTGVLFGLLGFWIIIIVKNKLESDVSFIYGFMLLLLAHIFVFWEAWHRVNKASTWACFFIGIGITQLVIEHSQLKLKFLEKIKKKI